MPPAAVFFFFGDRSTKPQQQGGPRAREPPLFVIHHLRFIPAPIEVVVSFALFPPLSLSVPSICRTVASRALDKCADELLLAASHGERRASHPAAVFCPGVNSPSSPWSRIGEPWPVGPDPFTPVSSSPPTMAAPPRRLRLWRVASPLPSLI